MGIGRKKKKKRGDSIVESSDSPKIPDGDVVGGVVVETSDIPSLPSGLITIQKLAT